MKLDDEDFFREMTLGELKAMLLKKGIVPPELDTEDLPVKRETYKESIGLSKPINRK